MNLSKSALGNIKRSEGLFLPVTEALTYPERVLQFGTGVLLRGLPDFIINEANNKGKFKGRIVIVKSTVQGSVDAFADQEGLYTVCVRGVKNDETISENHVIGVVSRVLSAATEWDKVIECASNPAMQVIVSNTTEVGIALVKDNIHADPPQSFPGKVLSFLYHRFKFFKGDPAKGMVVIPTELIPDNGDKLLSIVLELAHLNNLEISFIDWLENANYFCNSLVDRIVPGKLKPAEQALLEASLGYQDELLVMSEVYSLWAIQSSNEKVKEILSFATADSAAIVAPDIQVFRELKLRLLNAPHTFGCGLAYLCGFDTVKESLDDEIFSGYIQTLMFDEIIPSVVSETISNSMAGDFANKVLDRYRNSFIEHAWINITLQYSTKMSLRNIALIQNYCERFGQVPIYMSIGMAGHILFLRTHKTSDGYNGSSNGTTFQVKDDHASFYAEAWQNGSVSETVRSVLGNRELWGSDLNHLPEFTDTVTFWLETMIDKGVPETLASAAKQKIGMVNEK